jgi:hypothetical protein
MQRMRYGDAHVEDHCSAPGLRMATGEPLEVDVVQVIDVAARLAGLVRAEIGQEAVGVDQPPAVLRPIHVFHVIDELADLVGEGASASARRYP